MCLLPIFLIVESHTSNTKSIFVVAVSSLVIRYLVMNEQKEE